MTPHSSLSVAGAAPLPDLSVLADLSPGVAYAALGTIVIVTLLFHFGGTIRDRLRPKPPEPKPEVTAQTSAQALPQAVDTATQANDRFINHLLATIAKDAQERDEIVSRLIRERNEAQRQVQDLSAELMRLQQMLWRQP